MDKEPPTAHGEAPMANPPAHPVTLTNYQFEQLLIAVRDHQLSPMDKRLELTPEQRRAFTFFENVAIGLGVTGFGKIAAPLTRHGNDLVVDVPKHAWRARVYSQSGVHEIPLDDCHGSVAVSHDVAVRVGRVEFFDRAGVLLEVTGGERLPKRDVSTPA